MMRSPWEGLNFDSLGNWSSSCLCLPVQGRGAACYVHLPGPNGLGPERKRTLTASGAWTGGPLLRRRMHTEVRRDDSARMRRYFEKQNAKSFHPTPTTAPKVRSAMIWTLWMGMAAPASARKSPSSTASVSCNRHQADNSANNLEVISLKEVTGISFVVYYFEIGE